MSCLVIFLAQCLHLYNRCWISKLNTCTWGIGRRGILLFVFSNLCVLDEWHCCASLWNIHKVFIVCNGEWWVEWHIYVPQMKCYTFTPSENVYFIHSDVGSKSNPHDFSFFCGKFTLFSSLQWKWMENRGWQARKKKKAVQQTVYQLY